ncbi:MAG TPA: lysophospholipid acyltransferase family protein [Gammaproteobacteria bacterium]|nr:lysophospholipid acyltransferase family protein [Gammaproteobacteria bacterium]
MTAALVLTVLLAAAAFGLQRLLRAARQARGAEWGVAWVNRLDGLNRLFCRRYHRLQAEPLALPATGPAIVVANHLSGLDPLLLLASSPRPLRFLIATEEYRRPLLNRLFRAAGCIPVDRGGRPERAFRAALRALRDGEVIALFPEGAVHGPDNPARALRPGVARLARLARCPVVPARVSGVRRPGRVFPALVLRGAARLEAGAPFRCEGVDTEHCLEEVAAAIGTAG